MFTKEGLRLVIDLKYHYFIVKTRRDKVRIGEDEETLLTGKLSNFYGDSCERHARAWKQTECRENGK